jgi:Zn-finger nucleic acid-binding protein
MQCPVCKEVQLVMTERQNIEIDYCPQCRGVWLDRGELDKIIERSQHANDSFLTQSNSFATRGLEPSVPQAASPSYPPEVHGGYGENNFGNSDHHGDNRGPGNGYAPNSQGGFLRRLFD